MTVVVVVTSDSDACDACWLRPEKKMMMIILAARAWCDAEARRAMLRSLDFGRLGPSYVITSSGSSSSSSSSSIVIIIVMLSTITSSIVVVMLLLL